jgi:replicative DNA helicase
MLLNMMKQFSKQNKNCLLFSLEMTKEDIGIRLRGLNEKDK